MSHVKRRCDQCGARTTGRLCVPCDYARRSAPPAPCTDCHAPLHRRSTPPEERVKGSRFYGAHGRCTSCLKRAQRAGIITPEDKRTMVAVPQPRIIVGARLTLEERVDALCAQVDPEVFFPETGGSNIPAKKICAQCPIRERCLEVALINKEQIGVFGGLSAEERRVLRQERRAEEAA